MFVLEFLASCYATQFFRPEVGVDFRLGFNVFPAKRDEDKVVLGS